MKTPGYAVVALSWLWVTCLFATTIQAQDAGRDAGTEQERQDVADAVADAVELESLVSAARQTEALLEEGATTVEPSPGTGSIRVRLQESRARLTVLRERLTPEELATAGRAVLGQYADEVEGLARDRDADDEALEARAAELSELTARLDDEVTAWERVRDALRAAEGVSPIAPDRVAQLLRDLDELGAQAAARTATVANLLSELATHGTELGTTLETLHTAQAEERARLFNRTAPLWAVIGTVSGTGQGRPQIADAWDEFYSAYRDDLPFHGGLLILLFAAVFGLRRFSRVEEGAVDPDLAILARPFAAVMLVALVAARYLYPLAPVSIFHIAALIAILPVIRLLPVLIRDRALHVPVYGLLALFSVHEIDRFVPMPAPFPRLLDFGVTLSFLSWLVFVIKRYGPRLAASEMPPLIRAAPWILRAVVFSLAVSVFSEIAGYSNLARLLTDGLLILGYALILLIAALRVAMALFATAIRSRPLHVSRAAGQHGPLIIRNVRNVLYLLTAFTWLYLALVVFDLEHSFVNAMTALLSAELALGSWAVSLGDVLRFVLVLVVTRYIAKIVVFFLEDDILPRLSLPRGAPVTISRLVRYVIWAIGFVVAIGAAGADMGSVALLVSALGIGIGFGLQNIVNNFVSGLILIFERPIRAGDVVEIGGMVARTKEIGLRASIVRTLEGAEVIVPNSDLVSEQVINWTLSDQQRRVDIPVGVVYGTDPESVLDLLMVAAKEVPEVLDDPSAVPLFIGFGANSLDFELRFWMSHQQEWPMVASRVLVQINRLLREAEIEIPFPQRDLHIRSVAPEVAKAFRDEAS